jgi:hypothetical protein
MLNSHNGGVNTVKNQLWAKISDFSEAKSSQTVKSGKRIALTAKNRIC